MILFARMDATKTTSTVLYAFSEIMIYTNKLVGHLIDNQGRMERTGRTLLGEQTLFTIILESQEANV